MSLSYYKLAVILDKDSGGQNGAANQALQIYKADGVTLATIYSDAAGTTPIAQPGAVTDAQGNFEFYASAGTYIAKSASFELQIFVGTDANVKTFANLQDALDYDSFSVDGINYGRILGVGDFEIVDTNPDGLYEELSSGGLYIKPKWDLKPCVSFIFDDAHNSHYDDVLPLFESRGYPLAFAITPKFTDEIRGLGDRLTTGEMLDAQKRGVEIINHSMTHANLSATTSAERVLAEVETCRQWLENRGLNNVGFLAASSAVNQDVLAPIYSRMSYGMTVFGANVYEDSTVYKGQSPYSLSRWTMEGVSSSATIDAIKWAFRNGRSIIMYDHDIPNPSTGYSNLVAVLDFLDTVSDEIDVKLPKDLIQRFCDIQFKQEQFKPETQVFNSTSAWSIPADLGASVTSQEIQLTPVATGPKTMTRDLFVEADKTYTFSCNVRSGSWTGTVSMGVHYLDGADAIIPGYSVEGGNIEYDGENLQRHSVESHSPTNAVKMRIFFRINPTVVDGTTLIIRDPSVYTGRRILFEDEKFTPTETSTFPYTPDLKNGQRDFFLRLDSASNTLNNPINASVLDEITFHIRANGVNRSIVFDTEYALNPNTAFNTNTTGDLMIVKFRYYRNEWIQVADTAWIT